MYDIKTLDEYKEYVVPKPDPPERSHALASFQEYIVSERRRFFGYRTTNFPGAAALRRLHPGRPQAIPDAIPSGPRERRPTRYNRGSSMFRLSVYQNNVWVQPLADITGRYRLSSPELYREQPTLTHRLVSWANRELTALLPASRIGAVLVEVMDLIEQYPIDSREFRRAMRPHIGRYTHHFVHEFYHFARSPYDMVGHDNAAQYVPRFGFEDSSSSSDDSDAVVEVDVSGNPIPSSSSHLGPQNIEREETLTNEGSVVISSDDSSSSEATEQTHFFMQLGMSTREPDLTKSHNPEPPPLSSTSMRSLLGRARNFLNSVNEGASTSRSDDTVVATPGPSQKRENPSNSGDSDACIIVEEVNSNKIPLEVISLDSDEESKGTLKKKLSNKLSGMKNKKQEKKGKHKPNLKRHNFPLTGASCSRGSSSGRQSMKEDHSYCSERKPPAIGGSSSTGASSCSGPMQTSSIEISLKWHSHSENSGSVVSLKKKRGLCESKRSRSSSSNSVASNHDVPVKKRKHKEKSKHTISGSSSKVSDRPKNENHKSNLQQKGKPSTQSSDASGGKKDHRSKVKSSSRSSSVHGKQSQDRISREVQSHGQEKHVQSNSSETSSNNMSATDNIGSPPSTSWTECSSRDNWYPDNHRSRDSSHDSRSSLHKERRGEGSAVSKSRHSSKKRKHKSKKKGKKSKHKKKSKAKRVIYSSDSDSDSSDSLYKKRRKRKRVVESPTSDSDMSFNLNTRSRPKKAKKLSESSSS
ncbi:hypothetical protein Pmani_024369 [Petrolisthes manimaculis]|uniref:RING-type E3 ubiquitin transferase n=2 Tax=Petrolisthes manimaculis TaxID=1843537 RepID=A0AAE1TZE7_9EUCA|nr:hypothetical protein Pmani_024369 [Petrolisthes manimaculis]